MIIYFSATGNTKYCAEFISHSINDNNIVSLNDMMRSGHDDIDCGGEKLIGIFSPVYDWDMSYAVSDFLRGLTFRNVSDDCYVYNDIESRRNIFTVKGRKLPGFMMFMIRKFFIPSQKNGRHINLNVSL